MADPAYPLLDHIGAMIAAVAALGTAAAGLVDTTKLLPWWTNVSYRGRSVLKDALAPFSKALKKAIGDDWLDAVMGHWINGEPKDDQKKQTKALIRLGLATGNVKEVADAGHVVEGALGTAVDKLEKGSDLDTADTNVLGRLDASIDAILDAAYDRADQQYRNTAKWVSGIFAVVLSVWGNGIYNTTVTAKQIAESVAADPQVIALHKTMDATAAAHSAYLMAVQSATAAAHPPWYANWEIAILVGIIAVPLAPVAKDLTSALQSGVKAIASIAAKP